MKTDREAWDSGILALFYDFLKQFPSSHATFFNSH